MQIAPDAWSQHRSSLRDALIWLAWCSLAWWPVLALATPAAQTLTVRYSPGGTAPAYALKVLKLALDKSGQPYRLVAITGAMTTPRIISDIRSNRRDGVNVFWAASHDALEQALWAVPIPIERGLIGYRLLAIRQASGDRLSRITTMAELKTLTLLQGLGWSDVALLRHHGMHVIEAAPEQLYKMLAAGRADAFPRSVLDADRELRAQQPTRPPLAIARHLALLYPRFGVFFFVSRDNPALHAALENGLNSAIRDGSFSRLYEHDPDIRAALKRLQEPRQVFILPPAPGSSRLLQLPPALFDARLSAARHRAP